MGPESRRSRGLRSRACQNRSRRQDLGRDGYAEGAEGQACELQDTSGIESCGRIAQKCDGEEYMICTLIHVIER